VDENIIEVEQIDDGHVVLVIPSVRLIVMGRTFEEARAWARAAIECRGSGCVVARMICAGQPIRLLASSFAGREWSPLVAPGGTRRITRKDPCEFIGAIAS
jgi:hypothetical protein